MAQIKHQIVVEAPAAKVFPLVSTGGGFKQWWAADVTETDAAVSKGTTDVVKLTLVELGFFKRSTLYRLQQKRVAEPNEAEWCCTTGKEWDGTRMVFALQEDNGKTTVRFTHADWKAETDYFVSCNTTWGELMFRLKAAAEGKAPGPLFSAEGMAY
jgi:uncharacterized protein YndB with AHSA1/START domain